jgi:hypothetical protein
VVKADREQLQTELAVRGLELGEAVSISHMIEAASARVWQVISQPGQLTRYHPFCQATTVIQWPGVGAKDTVTYYSGVHYERDFVTWIEGVGFDIDVGPPSHKTARVEWRITELGEHRSELAITVMPYVKADVSAPRKQTYQQRCFGDLIAQYLESVVLGVGHVVTIGEAVQKNQSGTHPLYSE